MIEYLNIDTHCCYRNKQRFYVRTYSKVSHIKKTTIYYENYLTLISLHANKMRSIAKWSSCKSLKIQPCINIMKSARKCPSQNALVLRKIKI